MIHWLFKMYIWLIPNDTYPSLSSQPSLTLGEDGLGDMSVWKQETGFLRHALGILNKHS